MDTDQFFHTPFYIFNTSLAPYPGGCYSLLNQKSEIQKGKRNVRNLSRREFIKTLSAGAAVTGLGGITVHTPLNASERGRFDIGQCKSLRIKCISELVGFEEKKLIETVVAAGGHTKSQWMIPWDPENAAGFCSLVDIESLDGVHHKFLIDAGWNKKYMDACFKREGIDRMLQKDEIEFVFISHEHLDHLWGIEAILKYNPDIKIMIPDTFYSEGMHLINGAAYLTAGAGNRIPHKGKLVRMNPGYVNRLYDGCAAVGFNIPLTLRARGEQSLFVNIKDKGIVCVTGCCHQGITTMADFGQRKIAGGETLYGVYGGLHLSHEDGLAKKQEKIIKDLAKYQFKKIACNHCTGIPAVKKMIELGYPVIQGSGRYGSKSKLYIGNGDEVIF